MKHIVLAAAIIILAGKSLAQNSDNIPAWTRLATLGTNSLVVSNVLNSRSAESNRLDTGLDFGREVMIELVAPSNAFPTLVTQVTVYVEVVLKDPSISISNFFTEHFSLETYGNRSEAKEVSLITSDGDNQVSFQRTPSLGANTYAVTVNLNYGIAIWKESRIFGLYFPVSGEEAEVRILTTKARHPSLSSFFVVEGLVDGNTIEDTATAAVVFKGQSIKSVRLSVTQYWDEEFQEINQYWESIPGLPLLHKLALSDPMWTILGYSGGIWWPYWYIDDDLAPTGFFALGVE